MAGEYVGVSGDIGIGAGVGANILMGGSGRTIALQPVSVEGSVAVTFDLAPWRLRLTAAAFYARRCPGIAAVNRGIDWRIYRSRARGGSVHATPERVMLDLKTTYAIKRAVATGQAVRMDRTDSELRVRNRWSISACQATRRSSLK